MGKFRKIGLLGIVAASVCALGAYLYAPSITAHPLAGKQRLADRIGKSDVSLNLVEIATGLTAPNWGAAAPGLLDHLFVTDQPGILWAIDINTGDKTVFMDVSASGLNLLVPMGFAGPGTFDERGLLGVAFHPDYDVSTASGYKKFYTYTSEPALDPDPNLDNADFPFPVTTPAAEVDHHSVISEWTAINPAEPGAGVDPNRRVLMTIAQPQFNHDGGALNFDAADNLYISLGDGGGADDDQAGHTMDLGNGQDTSNVLGTILRIDPTGMLPGDYSIPGDNPSGTTGGQAGCDDDGFCDEIYAYGLRNPFRFSIDSNGDLWVGDVGQNDIEEVTRVMDPGENHGWKIKEGSFCFDVDADGTGFAFDPEGALCPGDDGSLIDPIAEYDNHIEGHSVIGGFICDGCGIPGVEGRYVFGDFAKVFVFTFNSVDPEEAAATGVIKLSVAPGRLFHLDADDNIVEFKGNRPTGVVLGMGQDASGAIYVLGNATGLPTPGDTTGTVHRLEPGGGGMGPP